MKCTFIWHRNLRVKTIIKIAIKIQHFMWVTLAVTMLDQSLSINKSILANFKFIFYPSTSLSSNFSSCLFFTLFLFVFLFLPLIYFYFSSSFSLTFILSHPPFHYYPPPAALNEIIVHFRPIQISHVAQADFSFSLFHIQFWSSSGYYHKYSCRLFVIYSSCDGRQFNSIWED